MLFYFYFLHLANITFCSETYSLSLTKVTPSRILPDAALWAQRVVSGKRNPGQHAIVNFRAESNETDIYQNGFEPNSNQ